MSLNKKVAIILTEARKQEKWVSISTMLQYGLAPSDVRMLLNHDYINVVADKEHGSIIKLNLAGYKHMTHIKEGKHA